MDASLRKRVVARVAHACVFGVAACVALAVAGPLDGVVPLGEDPDEQKSRAAKPAELEALTAKLGHTAWRVREQSMTALIAMGETARGALRSAVRSGDAEVRWRAGYALSRLGGSFAKPEADRARALYASAAEARAQAGAGDVARLLYREVIKRFPRTRWAAAARERLAALGPDPGPANAAEPEAKLIARLVAQLGSANWAERQEASWRLAQLGTAAGPALTKAAAGRDAEVAWRARRVLKAIEASRSRPMRGARRSSVRLGMLARLFGEDDPSARPTDIDDLVRTLGSGQPAELAHAREVLLNLGADAVGALMRSLDGCSEVVGVEIMDLLHHATGQKLGFDAARWQAWWRTLQRDGEK